MTGMIMDGVLMLLLVAALGYGIRLEKKLTALRAGQAAFATAVGDLNTAAQRAEAALANLRASGQETDLLHDRIVKARELKQQLEGLMARGESLRTPARAAPEPVAAPVRAPIAQAPAAGEDEGRALRMAALAQRIQGLAEPAPTAAGRNNVSAILGAMGAQPRRAPEPARRRAADEDLFAA